MNTKEISADFQFLGNRVCKFKLETFPINVREKAEVNFEIDYKIGDISEENNTLIGRIVLKEQIKATVKKKTLYKCQVEVEGVFAGNPEVLNREKFKKMVELNGLVTLFHILRAYLIGVSAQSGINPPIKTPMINVMKIIEAKSSMVSPQKGES
ncbi:MAG: protein-export chaperone SecB [Peptococcaceae bacterium]|jgi:preprotein translocase subunit SecB|nr:protein-export chaperone SecB [Peptococcaceae bacterium]MDH7525858.1 protein-export chaperone SecB [Peptococcaceae bacterium]